MPWHQLQRCESQLNEASFRSGSFAEWGAFFLGHICRDSQGMWFDVTQFLMSRGASELSTAGTFEFSAEIMRNLAEDMARLQETDPKLTLVGWSHTHPPGWQRNFTTPDVVTLNGFTTGENRHAFGHAFTPSHRAHIFFSAHGREPNFTPRDGINLHAGYYLTEAQPVVRRRQEPEPVVRKKEPPVIVRRRLPVVRKRP